MQFERSYRQAMTRENSILCYIGRACPTSINSHLRCTEAPQTFRSLSLSRRAEQRTCNPKDAFIWKLSFQQKEVCIA